MSIFDNVKPYNREVTTSADATAVSGDKLMVDSSVNPVTVTLDKAKMMLNAPITSDMASEFDEETLSENMASITDVVMKSPEMATIKNQLQLAIKTPEVTIIKEELVKSTDKEGIEFLVAVARLIATPRFWAEKDVIKMTFKGVAFGDSVDDVIHTIETSSISSKLKRGMLKVMKPLKVVSDRIIVRLEAEL